MSLLTIIQQAAPILGIAKPAAVIGSSDLQVQQLLEIAQEEGHELAKRHDWRQMTKAGEFQAVDDFEQPGSLPGDYDRMAQGATMWNSTQRWPIAGPVTPEQWADLQGRPVVPTVQAFFRIIGTAFWLYPAPAASDVVTFEYQSKIWCRPAAGGAPQTEWQADTDLGVIDERLMKLGIIWRWKRAKGFDYAEELSTYERNVEREAGRSNGRAVISMARHNRRSDVWPRVNVPANIPGA